MLIHLLFEQPTIYLMFAVSILFALSVHEYSHAQCAYFLGDPTAKMNGRLTLNPLSHFDPIGSLLIFIFGIGWGKPVPFNPYNLKNSRWGPALVALAGPLSNFFLALLAGLFIRFFKIEILGLLLFLTIFCWLNIILGIFNLLPVPPLDGSHILFAILPPSFSKIKVFILENSLILLFLVIFFVWHFLSPLAEFIFWLITGLPSPF